jgi:hypothetical protein
VLVDTTVVLELLVDVLVGLIVLVVVAPAQPARQASCAASQRSSASFVMSWQLWTHAARPSPVGQAFRQSGSPREASRRHCPCAAPQSPGQLRSEACCVSAVSAAQAVMHSAAPVRHSFRSARPLARQPFRQLPLPPDPRFALHSSRQTTLPLRASCTQLVRSPVQPATQRLFACTSPTALWPSVTTSNHTQIGMQRICDLLHGVCTRGMAPAENGQYFFCANRADVAHLPRSGLRMAVRAG